ncbi:MAG TPA: hypothetical protein PK640_00785 [Verrucomicrobiota bacterium]|nr:hypothetical protein [Verrucomicrobiota bacterium]
MANSLRWARRICHVVVTRPSTRLMTTAPKAPASFGLRRRQRQVRSARCTGRARIGSLVRNRPSSSAKSWALA